MSEKYYTLSTTNTETFNEVYNELTTGVLVSRNVVCEDIMNHSPTRAEFLLTDEEATVVGDDDRVSFINLTPARYPDIYNATEDDLRMDVKLTTIIDMARQLRTGSIGQTMVLYLDHLQKIQQQIKVVQVLNY